jgi:DNA-binding MarR family transcriptional regulator
MANIPSTTGAPARQKLQASSWFAVVRAYQECNRRYAQLLQAFDLTIAQFDLLNAVHRLADQAMPKLIAEKLLVTRGNITGVLRRLQERKLIATREQEHDGRSFVCYLTPAGAELLQQAHSATVVFVNEQLAPFSDADLQQTEKQMKRMLSHLQTIDPAALADSLLKRAGHASQKGKVE